MYVHELDAKFCFYFFIFAWDRKHAQFLADSKIDPYPPKIGKHSLRE